MDCCNSQLLLLHCVRPRGALHARAGIAAQELVHTWCMAAKHTVVSTMIRHDLLLANECNLAACSGHVGVQEVASLIAAVPSTTMFLLQRRGPTCFVVKDGASGMKSTVQIGLMQSCSCQCKMPAAVRMTPCAHVVFVMLKVLQIPSQNPIVWQASLTGAIQRHAACVSLNVMSSCATSIAQYCAHQAHTCTSGVAARVN